MRLFDSHCHLQDEAFAGDLGGVIERAQEAGVAAMVLCGYDAPSNLAALTIAGDYAGIYPATGFHPHEAATVSRSMLDELEAQVSRPEVIAVGEIGLDFYRDHSPHDVQRRVLDEQLAIALRVGKPVAVHTRGAEEAIYPHIQAYAVEQQRAFGPRPVGVMHCFGGTLEQAQRYVEIGFLVSVACTVTYPSNSEGRRMVAGLPLSALTIETDSPYLPPQGRRGQRNEPSYIEAAARAIATAHGITTQAAAEATFDNAARLFAVAGSRETVGAR